MQNKLYSNDNIAIGTDTLFTLDSEELVLAKSKHNAENQLAFAVILKFFQIEGRYPINSDYIHEAMIRSLSIQLGCEHTDIHNYNWNNRTSKRFRQEIRQLLGYQKATAADSKKLIDWLIECVLPQAPTLAQSREQARQFFIKRMLEPFAPKKLDRYIRSAYHQFEKRFFSNIFSQLSTETKRSIDCLLDDDSNEAVIDDGVDDNQIAKLEQIKLRHIKKGMAGTKLKHIAFEIDKLQRLREIKVPTEIFTTVSRKLFDKYYMRILAESLSNIKRHNPPIKYATMVVFCHIRSQLMTDDLAELLIQLIHKMRTAAETFTNKHIVSEVKCVNGKFDILYLLASTAVANPDGVIQEKIYPQVSKDTLQDLSKELQFRGRWYQNQVQVKMRSLYSHAHRKGLLALLDAFNFYTDSPDCKGLLQAITFIKQHRDLESKYYPDSKAVPITDIIPITWYNMVVEPTDIIQDGSVGKINSMNYEIAILEELRKYLRCKLIWIEGAYRYRNPKEDLPKDFDERKEYYYQLLNLPLKASDFVQTLKELVHQNLQQLNDTILSNSKVKILDKNGGRIKITPFEAQAEPANLKALQQAIIRRWPTINLIDILKETDLRLNFTQHFHTVASRESIDKHQLLKRLLLCLYAIGTNAGLKRVHAANSDSNYSDLRYTKRTHINKANVKSAIVEVINAIIAIRDPRIWGVSTTGCACDSTQVSAWDQNLMTEWHIRHNGPSVMIYWHVDQDAACIHSQLKTCSSSEVGSMIQGVLHHCTKMDMKQGYVDSHGQSVIGFGFCYLLHFDLLPRLKNINKQKLYYPTAKHKDKYPNLSSILEASINWDYIEESYNEVVKHTAALRTGTVEPEVMIKHFSKDNYNHPVYKALTEIGKAVKTIFLCRYLSSEELRIEINEALNVVERLNSIMGFIFYGKLGEISTNNKEDQELAVACLHLLQVCMVYINTLIIQEALADSVWKNKWTPEDRRALTPLLHAHINPYGLFPLDLDQRLIIETNKIKEAA